MYYIVILLFLSFRHSTETVGKQCSLSPSYKRKNFCLQTLVCSTIAAISFCTCNAISGISFILLLSLLAFYGSNKGAAVLECKYQQNVFEQSNYYILRLPNIALLLHFVATIASLGYQISPCYCILWQLLHL